MARHVLLALFVAVAVVPFASAQSSGQLVGPIVDCRHNESERPPDRVRREQALALARQINAAEGKAAEQSRRYRRLTELPSLSPTPAGFEVRFYTDGVGYTFSIKDKLDVCRYAIFSDQDGLIYERTPQAAQIASVTR